MRIISCYPLMFLVLVCSICISCETEIGRLERIKIESERRIVEEKALAEKLAIQKKNKEEADRRYAETAEIRRIEQEKAKREKHRKEEEERRKVAELEKWKTNSLRTGATPWSQCYGYNSSCSDWGCSQIKVKTPFSSNVIVTIKEYDNVVRHAFIKKNSSYTIEVPNGRYQPFFYYGNGWNPNKLKKSNACGSLHGAFVSGEKISKDNPQTLNNSILSYELILQQNGNLQTQSSNEEEAF